MQFFVILKLASLFLLGIIFLGSCDTTVEPFSEGPQEYSIYGPLTIGSSPNYIRVHDTRAKLTSEGTRELDAEVTFTNMETGESSQLTDVVERFDNIYTHNFKAEMSIDYDSRYQVDLKDGEGYTASITTVTPQQTNPKKLNDVVFCAENFQIELTNIDREAGERVDIEVGIEVGEEWQWTRRIQSEVYDSETNTLRYGWSALQISKYVFGPNDYYECEEFSSDKIRFRFTHIGAMEDRETPEDPIQEDDIILPGQNNQVVLAKYSGETEVRLDPSVFENP